MVRLARWLKRHVTIAACAACVAYAACVALPLAGQSTRDSAGIHIVENARPNWTARERLTLAARPQLIIGDSADAPYRFRRVRGVVRLADGRIAVTDGESQQLRLFSADGRFLSATPLQSAAPGQRSSIGLVRRLRGDTIAIGSGFATISLYTSSGAFVRTLSPSSEGAGSGRPASRSVVLDMLANGQRVVAPLPTPTSKPIGTQWADSLTLQLLGADESTSVPLGRVPYIEFVQTRTGPTPPWLSAIGVFATGDDRVYTGFGNRYEIRAFATDGTLRSIIRRAWAPEPITSGDWEQWVVEWSKLWVTQTGAARDSAVDAVRREPYAEELPAFSALLVDRRGWLWVRRAHWQDAIGAGSLADMPAVPSQWSVFEREGRWLGDVEMPSHFQPFEIGADYVVGAARRNNITQVVLYPLVRFAK